MAIREPFLTGIAPSYPRPVGRSPVPRSPQQQRKSLCMKLAWAIANMGGFLLLTLLLISLVSLALGYRAEAMESFLSSWGPGIARFAILTISIFASLVFCDSL